MIILTKNFILNEIYEKVKKIENIKKRKIIETIIKNKNWYIDIDFDMFYDILLDLGYDKESIFKIYKELVIV